MTDGANAWGQPTATLPNQSSGFYAGPWECLLMTATDWWTFIGTRVSSMPSDMNGLIYVDNDNTKQNQSTSVNISGGSGSGVLYIDGNFYVNGNLTYRGLIYAEKQIQVQGKIWVLGAIVSREGIQIQTTGNGSAILYSSEAIAQAVGGTGASLIRLAWHEY
jgi:hypothetical protein